MNKNSIIYRWSEAVAQARGRGIQEDQLLDAAKSKLGYIPELPKGLAMDSSGQIVMDA